MAKDVLTTHDKKKKLSEAKDPKEVFAIALGVSDAEAEHYAAQWRAKGHDVVITDASEAHHKHKS